MVGKSQMMAEDTNMILPPAFLLFHSPEITTHVF